MDDSPLQRTGVLGVPGGPGGSGGSGGSGGAGAATGGASTGGRSPRRRVYALNLIRVTLFTLVLFVHSVGSINWDPEHYRGMQLFTMLVHCARYGFVFVTGFVLFLAYHRSRIGAGVFWRRRFGFVVMPYAAWTVIYILTGYVFSGRGIPGAGDVAGDIATALVQGNAKYQLYFLLISMQIYLMFPAVRVLLRRTEGRHGRVLAAAAAVQVGVFVLLSLWHPGYGWYGHMWKVLPTYALFLIGGALAAVHYERFAPWVRRHRAWLLVLVAAGTAFSIPMFFATSSHAYVPEMAFAAYSIENLPWYLAAVALLYVSAQAWEDRRGDGSGRFARLVDYGSVRAFGIFAVHPLVLDLIHQTDFVDWLYATFPDATAPRSILLGIVTLIGTLSAVELILHTPLSRVLVARNMLRPPRSVRPEAADLTVPYAAAGISGAGRPAAELRAPGLPAAELLAPELAAFDRPAPGPPTAGLPASGPPTADSRPVSLSDPAGTGCEQKTGARIGGETEVRIG